MSQAVNYIQPDQFRLLTDAFLARTTALTEYHKMAGNYKFGIDVEIVKITKVIFNDPATIVMWSDGTKTVVKCGEHEAYDPEKGMAMAIAKKFLGTSESKGDYYEVFKKWIIKDVIESRAVTSEEK